MQMSSSSTSMFGTLDLLIYNHSWPFDEEQRVKEEGGEEEGVRSFGGF